MGQLDMFGPCDGPEPGAVVHPATVDARLVATARRLPARVRMGAAGWAHPGWQGAVYRHAHPAGTLERHGLSAYAQHPLLRTVSLERSRHRAPAPQLARQWIDQTPADFRFVAFASHRSTCASFRRGEANPDFLDPVVGAALLEPLLQGFGERLGVVIVELPRVHPSVYGGRASIPDRLQRFLGALPPGPTYAVQPHDHKWLGPAYVDALVATGAVHCIGVHPSSPPVAEQHRLTARAGGCVVHWSSGPRFDYDSTRRYLEPYDALSRPDVDTRTAVGRIVEQACDAAQEVWVLVGNEAEGCAPRSIDALAQRLSRTETGPCR